MIHGHETNSLVAEVQADHRRYWCHVRNDLNKNNIELSEGGIDANLN